MLFVIAAVSSCKSNQVNRDPHESPTSVIQAMFQGLKDKDTEAILDTFSPAVREAVKAEMRKRPVTDDLGVVDEHMKRQWGLTLKDLDTERITVEVQGVVGNKKHVDARLNGRSYRDQATVVEIDGRWFIEEF